MQVIGPAGVGAVKSCWRWPPPASVPKSARGPVLCDEDARPRAGVNGHVAGDRHDFAGVDAKGILLPSSRKAVTAAVPPSNATSLPPVRKTVKT